MRGNQMILTTKDIITVDLAELNKRGFFKTDRSQIKLSWQYSIREVIVEFVLTFVRSDKATLAIQYPRPTASDATRDVTEVIQLTTTPCRYGGIRYWATCPGCAKRVRRLYISHNKGLFSCAKCNKLIYPSQMPRPRAMPDIVRYLECIWDLEARMARLRSPKRIAAVLDRIERLMDKLQSFGCPRPPKLVWQP